MSLFAWNNTQKVLEEMAPELLDKYKELANTENVTVTVGDLEVTLHLPPYWMYIEYGRRAGKFPPIQSIEDWVVRKRIVPRGNTTIPQVSYLIARKISKEGTVGKHAAEGTVESVVKNVFLERLYLAIGQDVKQALSQIK